MQRERERERDEVNTMGDLITRPAHIHLVYFIRSNIQREAGGEESGYQFDDMKMISIDTGG